MTLRCRNRDQLTTRTIFSGIGTLCLCCKVTGAETIELHDVNIEVGLQSVPEQKEPEVLDATIQERNAPVSVSSAN